MPTVDRAVNVAHHRDTMKEDRTIAFDADEAREVVLAWLREPQRVPLFLCDATHDELRDSDLRIVERFMSWVSQSGFGWEFINEGSSTQPSWTVHWQYRNAEFVGFRQPPSVPDRNVAGLLACAALLRNEWCFVRLR